MNEGKSGNVRYPSRVARIRSFIDSIRIINNPIKVFEEYSSQFGDTYCFYFGGIKKAIVSSNSDFIQHILKSNYKNYKKSEIQIRRMGHFLGQGLLTSHGQHWITQRRIIQQGFHKNELMKIYTTMTEVLESSLDRAWHGTKAGDSIDIYSEMMKITFRMVMRSLFSTDLKEEDLEAVSDAISKVQAFMIRQILQPFLNPWFNFSGELARHEKMRDNANKIIFSYIQKRRDNHLAPRHDLLQVLVDAKYEDTGEGMTDGQILSESMQLMVAGHETSSNVLSWSLYLLAQHPDCVEKIRKETAQVTNNGPLLFEKLPQMEYTTQVLEEAMRLYPPFWMIDRESIGNDRIMGIEIPEDTIVISYVYGVHHSALYWKDPEKFIPERFSKENKKNHLPFTHLPFGGGPRGCIGSNYAMMQMILILSTIVTRYNFALSPGQKISMKPMIILRPNFGIKVTFSKKTIP